MVVNVAQVMGQQQHSRGAPTRSGLIECCHLPAKIIMHPNGFVDAILMIMVGFYLGQKKNK